MTRLKIYQNFNHIFIAVFFLCFVLQFIFWLKTEQIKPNIHLIPPVPSFNSVKALSLGDEEFYFRVLGLRIENAGDSFGRFSALKDYDYSKLYQWFKLLDRLNDQSSYIPSLAAIYYSQTQKKEDTKYLVQYLDEFSSRDVDKYWWWMFQASYIASSTLKDYPLSLKLAYKLSKNNNKQAPIWTNQLPAFIESKMGNDCGAFLLISKILQEDETGNKKITAKEMEFMRYFIKQHLNNLKKNNFNPNKCR